MFFVCHPNILLKHCLQFLLGVKMAPRETENNAYAKFLGDKQRALWYVMVFSGVVNCGAYLWTSNIKSKTENNTKQNRLTFCGHWSKKRDLNTSGIF